MVLPLEMKIVPGSHHCRGQKFNYRIRALQERIKGVKAKVSKYGVETRGNERG